MIRFELHVSPNFRGGELFADFESKDYGDLISNMEYCWNRSGLHHSKGEIFVHAYIYIDNQEQRVQCGYYTIDSDGDLIAHSSEDAEDELVEFWESLGINFHSTPDDELFEAKVKKLFEHATQEKNASKLPNSPENVLGKWLLATLEIYSYRIENFNEVQVGFSTAAILNLAKKHNKIFQMFEWLVGENGKEFLTRKDYSPIGSMIFAEVDQIKNTYQGNPTEKDIEKYLQEKYRPLHNEPKLY